MTYAILVAIIAFLAFLLITDAFGVGRLRERVARLEAQLKQAQDQAAPAARDDRIVLLEGLADRQTRRLEARRKRIELLEADVQRLSDERSTIPAVRELEDLRTALADREERNEKLKADMSRVNRELKILRMRSSSDYRTLQSTIKQQGKALREAQDELARTKFESEIRRRAHEVSHGVASRLKDKLDRIQKETQD